MPSNWPMVMTPVPPTPPTTMPHGCSHSGSTGSGSAGSVKGSRAPASLPFFGFLSVAPSTVMKLGQKPLTHE